MNDSLFSQKVIVVAHDAGGAAILASFVEEQQLDALFVLSGPAEKIFQERLGEIHVVSLLDALATSTSAWLLTGTGWQTDFEWKAIEQGRVSGKHVVTFLDHWVNYPSRFVRNGKTVYPNQIWVGDSYAAELTRRVLPGIEIRQVINPYFKHFVKDVKRIDRTVKYRPSHLKNILYVSENIDYEGFCQNDAIQYFMNNLEALGVEVGRIVLRPHPSELAEKYEWCINHFDTNMMLSDGSSLAIEVAASDIVVGCTSMAMALALMADRRVVSCIPNAAIEFTLPFHQIEHLADLILLNSL